MDLDAVAAALTAPLPGGRRAGIGAFDESPSTLGKRLVAAGLPNDPPTRAAWRECLFGADLTACGIAGAITFEEAIDQATGDGKAPLLSLLTHQRCLVGVKADQGLTPCDAAGAVDGEFRTRGLERLAAAAPAWAAAGARFTKWRAAFRVEPAVGAPTPAAIAANADELAAYAVACQGAGLVPIVEPELLIDGAHDADAAAAALTRVLTGVVAALRARGARLSGLLLKIMAVVPGADAPAAARPPDAALAAATLDVLAATLPPDVGGVVLLSGGLSEAGATELLQAVAAAAVARGAPWPVSFSFGRALQASALALWAAGRAAGREADAVPAARRAVEAAAAANAAAAGGTYEGPHPAAGRGELREGFRGMRDVEAEAREKKGVGQ